MTRIPADARAILAHGGFCYVAASTPAGPHLTPVVFAYHGGRLWLTTSRGSVKAKAWREDPSVAGLVRVGDRAVTFRGRVRIFDALDPFTWPSAVMASPTLVRAATRFTVKNARFFFGYAVDATQVPLAWAPPGRIFDGIELTSGRVLDLTSGEVIGGWGDWSSEPARRRRTPRRTAPSPVRAAHALDAGVPASVRRAVGTSGDGSMAFAGHTAGASLTVLPVRWSRRNGTFEARVADALFALAPAGSNGNVALTVDHASAWRAREMRGMLLRGRADAQVGHGPDALMRLRPERVVWWEGWSSGTVRMPVRAPETRPGMRDRAPKVG